MKNGQNFFLITFLESAYKAAYRIMWAKMFGHEKIYKHCPTLPVWVRTLCAESQVGNYLGLSRKLKVIYSYNIWTCFWSFTIQHFQKLLVWTGLPSRLSTRLLIEPIFFSMCEWFRGYLPGRIEWFLEQLDWSRI